ARRERFMSYNSDTLWRVYEIGGADLALRYADMSERAAAKRERETPREVSLRSLKFYAGSRRFSIPGEPQYADRFPRSETEFVYYQIELNNPWEYVSWEYNFLARFLNPNGTTDEVKGEYEVPGGTEWFRYSAGVGWDQPGRWEAGMYQVEVVVGYQSMATGTFWISEDKPLELWSGVTRRFGNGLLDLGLPDPQVPWLDPPRGK